MNKRVVGEGGGDVPQYGLALVILQQLVKKQKVGDGGKNDDHNGA